MEIASPAGPGFLAGGTAPGAAASAAPASLPPSTPAFFLRYPDGTLPLPPWLQPKIQRPSTPLFQGWDGTFPIPIGMQLYDFQTEGARFLAERSGALLCDEMGLGKSIQAIVALRWLFLRGDINRCLILCPKTLVWDWYRKIRRWAPDLSLVPIQGHRSRREYEWRYRADTFIAGYETWRLDGEFVPHQYDLVVLDEVQRVKNPGTELAKAVYRLQAPIRWGLSGTPMENSVAELEAVMSYLQPDTALGVPAGSVAGGAGVNRLRAAIRPHVLRRRKEHVLRNLPAKHHREVWLDLGPNQRRLYDQMEEQGLAQAPGGAEATTAYLLALLTKLKQVCNRCPETGQSAKLHFLMQDLSRIIPCGEKVLVFSQYPEVTLRHLLPALQPFGPALFSGDLSQWQREELLRCFEEEDWPRVLLVSLKAGGVGLTLTQANHVYHFDPWWNPAAAQQAEDRVHRIGQHRPVYVTTLLTRNTVEERVAAILAEKRELFSEVIDRLEKPPLGRQDLMSIFRLRSGATPTPAAAAAPRSSTLYH